MDKFLLFLKGVFLGLSVASFLEIAEVIFKIVLMLVKNI